MPPSPSPSITRRLTPGCNNGRGSPFLVGSASGAGTRCRAIDEQRE